MARIQWSSCWVLVLLASMVCPSPPVRAADAQPYTVDLASTENDAIDATLKATSQLVTLRTSAPVDPFGLIARARGDVNRLKTVLESYGYYQGSITITINGLGLDDTSLADALTAIPKGQDAHCKVSFTLGPLYHLGSIQIEGTLPDSARNTLQLSPGAPAVASDVLAGGARLLTSLQNQGYAFAKVDPPVAYEDPEKRVLNIRFNVATGPTVKIGEIQLEGLKRLHESFVRRRLLLHTGEPYSAIAVERARKDLLSLGAFSSVTVQLGDKPDSMGRVPITFQLRERLRHALGARTAYSTDLGASAGLTWSDRNVRGNAEQLDISAEVIGVGGTANTALGYNTSVKYTLPEFAHRDQSLQFSIGALKQSLQAYDQTSQTAAMTLSRKLSSIWTANAGISASHETIVQEGITHIYTLFALPLGALYDTTNLPSPLDDPTHGMRASFSLAPTLSRGEPDSTFIITQASVAGYFDLRGLFRTDPGRSVIALRALAGSALGANQVTETVNGKMVTVPDLPPDQRFYAGGSGTVRGYRYQAVGPEFGDGTPVGGVTMGAVNAEFRQRFGTSWGGVVFADAGQVSQNRNPLTSLFHGGFCSSATPSFEGCWAVGVGVGGRFYTPIGAIRLDFAVPTVSRTNDDKFEIYIGIGQSF